MKKTNVGKLVFSLGLLLVMVFSLSSMAFAGGAALTSLTVEQSGGGSASFSGSKITANMNTSVKASCSTVTIKANSSSDSTVSVDGTPMTSKGVTINLYRTETEVPIIVTSNDDASITSEYTLIVERGNADLKSLVIKDGGREVFSASSSSLESKTEFTTNKVASDANLTLEVTPINEDAVIKFNNAVDNDNKTILLQRDGSDTVVQITLSAGNTAKSYEVTIPQAQAGASNNALLDDLAVVSGSTDYMHSSFNANTDSYTVNIPYAISRVTIKPTVAQSGATVTVDGTTATSSGVSVNSPSGASTKVVKVEVLAPDGKTTKTYTLNLKLDQGSSDDKTLQSLSAKAGSSTCSLSPTFKSSETRYNITIPYDESSVTFSAAATSTKAKVAITESSSNPITSSSNYTNSQKKTYDAPSRGSSKYYYVYVRSEDGSTQSYRIYATRSSSNSSDNDLKNLVVKYGSTSYSLMPAFDNETEDYYVCVPNSASYVRLTPTTNNSNSTITVDGDTVKSGYASDEVSVSTSSSGTSISVKVKAANGSTKTYTVRVYRSGKSSGSNYDVDKVYLRAGKTSGSLNTVDLSPSFSNSTTSYKVALDSGYRYFSMRWDADDDDSKAFLIYGEDTKKLSEGSYSTSIKLDSGSTKVVLRVFSPDHKKSRDYTFNINDDADSDDYLKALSVTVDGYSKSLSPSFSKSTTSYTIKVGTQASYAIIKPTVNDSDSTVKVDGSTVKSGNASSSIKLNNNSTVIPVQVTAEDGSKRTYNITISKTNNNVDNNTGNSYNKKIVLRIGNKNCLYNGASKTLLAAPYTYKDRTMVPIRFVSEQLGATVDWNGKTKTVTITKDGKKLTMAIGKTSASLDVAPMVKNSTTFVPVRYVSEQLNAKVDWLGASKEVVITQ